MTKIKYIRKYEIDGKFYEFPEDLIFDMYRELKREFFVGIGFWCVLLGLVPFITLIIVLIKFPV